MTEIKWVDLLLDVFFRNSIRLNDGYLLETRKIRYHTENCQVLHTSIKADIEVKFGNRT